MKLLFVYTFLFLLFIYYACTSGKASSDRPAQKLSDTTGTVNFASHVKPILEKRCSPCHFTGGKMYVRMPFDQDTTLLNHQSSILKRIKDTEENEVIKKFVLQKRD